MSGVDSLRISGRLPSPKGVALAIIEVSRREDATIAEVARVIQADPALAGRLLHQANAAGLAGRPVASIGGAVHHLGMFAVRQLAVGFSLIDQHPDGPCRGFDYPRFWAHCTLMAVASQELGRVMHVGSPDELFACGLMAQIGRLALATVYPLEYSEVLIAGAEGAELLKLEREHLAVDHVALTAAIVADCGIPSSLADPITFHEAPDESGFIEDSRLHQLVRLFHTARRVADLGLAPASDRHALVPELMRLGGKIGMDPDAFGGLFDRIVGQWKRWCAALNLHSDDLPAFSDIAYAPARRVEPQAVSEPTRVLLVEDDPVMAHMMEAVLGRALGCSVRVAGNGRQALTLALEFMPQVVVTDWLMPVMDGLELCRALRATQWGQSMYVIMLTGQEDEERIVAAFEAGVDDYVTKPVNVRAINARMRAAFHYVRLLEAWEQDRAQLRHFAAELAVSNRRLEHMALTDPLTGLPNRRAGMDALARGWDASGRSGAPMAVLGVDVDHFKSINDRYGHGGGDVVLEQVARAIQSAMRKTDVVSRVGGEEFMLACQNTDSRTALGVAQRLLQVVRSLELRCADSRLAVTVSIGVASRHAGMKDADDLVRAADKALYAAKKAGRDRVCVYADGRFVLPETRDGAQGP